MTWDKSWAYKDIMANHLAERSAGIWWPQGWTKIINDLHLALKNLDPEYRVAQIKEKFEGLRYYIERLCEEDPERREVGNELIREAEAAAWYSCQQCGVHIDGVYAGSGKFGFNMRICSSCAYPIVKSYIFQKFGSKK